MDQQLERLRTVCIRMSTKRWSWEQGQRIRNRLGKKNPQEAGLENHMFIGALFEHWDFILIIVR